MKLFVVHQNFLLADTLVDPPIVDYIPLLVILHALVLSVPDVSKVTIFLDHVVSSVLFADNLASILKNAPTDAFHKIFCLISSLGKCAG